MTTTALIVTFVVLVLTAPTLVDLTRELVKYVESKQ